jgi:hypothetical protein
MKKPRIVAAVGFAMGRGTAQAAGGTVSAARGIAESKAREQLRRGRLEANQKRQAQAAERRAKWQALAAAECSESSDRSDWSARRMAFHIKIKKKYKKLTRKVPVETIRKALSGK